MASLPLLRPGLPQTDDGLFHYYRLRALDESVRAGAFYPRWFPQFAYGYGEPVLAFYGPGTYYLGEAASLIGLGPLAGLKLSLAMAFLVSGVATYGLARCAMGRWPAALAGAAYVLLPYHLADVYVRGAFAEHWGLALLPLSLLLLERYLARPSRIGWVALAVAWAAVVLLHNLTALMLAPAWAAYLLVLTRGQWRAWLRPALAVPAALALTAFYWLPIPFESHLVGLGNTFSTDAWRRQLAGVMDVAGRLPIYRYSLGQGVAYQYPLGLAAMMLLGLVLVACLIGWRRLAQRARLGFFFALLLAALAMQMRFSAPVWRLVPPAGFLQFPWRLMGLAGLAWAWLLGLGAELACGPSRLRAASWREAWLSVALLILVGFSSLWRLPVRPVAVPSDAAWVEHMWQNDFDIRQIGATWTAEYVPVAVSVDRSALPLDPVESDRPPSLAMPASAQLQVVSAGLTSFSLLVRAAEPWRLSWHQFDYPGWRVGWQGLGLRPSPYSSLGLASVTLPAGDGLLRVIFADTPLRLAGVGISLVAASGLLCYCLGRVRLSLRLPLALLAALCLGLLLTSAAKESPVTPSWVTFEGKLALTGWRFQASARPGDLLSADLYWLALRTPEEDYKVFLHLVSASGQVVAQSDGDPVGGFTHTRRLVGGELLLDSRLLALPESLPPGEYELEAGLYRWPAVQNLAATGGAATEDGRVRLGSLRVTR